MAPTQKTTNTSPSRGTPFLNLALSDLCLFQEGYVYVTQNRQTNHEAIRFNLVGQQLDLVSHFDLRRPDIVHPFGKPNTGPYDQ
jgi:hypothetical protein